MHDEFFSQFEPDDEVMEKIFLGPANTPIEPLYEVDGNYHYSAYCCNPLNAHYGEIITNYELDDNDLGCGDPLPGTTLLAPELFGENRFQPEPTKSRVLIPPRLDMVIRHEAKAGSNDFTANPDLVAQKRLFVKDPKFVRFQCVRDADAPAALRDRIAHFVFEFRGITLLGAPPTNPDYPMERARSYSYLFASSPQDDFEKSVIVLDLHRVVARYGYPMAYFVVTYQGIRRRVIASIRDLFR